MKKVCIVAPVHTWDDVRVFHKEANTLVSNEYSVILLAQSDKKRTENGIKIIPVWVPRSPRLLRILLNPLIFIQALLQKADIYHLHNPDTLPILFCLKIFRKKVIYDTHEDFSCRISIRPWIPKCLKKPISYFISRLEQLSGIIADGVIVTQEDVAKRLGKKSTIIRNLPRIDARYHGLSKINYREVFRSYHGVRAVYIGLITVDRGLFDMVDALFLVNQSHSVRLWLIGPSDIEDVNLAKLREGWHFVDYIERLPQRDAFEYVKRSDVGLALLHDVGDHKKSDPNKLYEYMSFGVPFIASNFSVWQNKLKGYDCGWFIPPRKPQLLADTLIKTFNNKTMMLKKQSCLDFVKIYNWENESNKLINLYSNIG